MSRLDRVKTAAEIVGILVGAGIAIADARRKAREEKREIERERRTAEGVK